MIESVVGNGQQSFGMDVEEDRVGGDDDKVGQGRFAVVGPRIERCRDRYECLPCVWRVLVDGGIVV